MIDFDPKVCNQCGKCCLSSVILDGEVKTINGLACRFLERENGHTRCSVYKNRFMKAPWCASVGEAYNQGLLPNDCPYVVDDPDYKGRTELLPIQNMLVLSKITVDRKRTKEFEL